MKDITKERQSLRHKAYWMRQRAMPVECEECGQAPEKEMIWHRKKWKCERCLNPELQPLDAERFTRTGRSSLSNEE